MMKKILSIGLAVLFAASLCACTSSAAQSLMPEPTVAPTSAPEDIRTNFEKASAYVESLLDGKTGDVQTDDEDSLSLYRYWDCPDADGAITLSDEVTVEGFTAVIGKTLVKELDNSGLTVEKSKETLEPHFETSASLTRDGKTFVFRVYNSKEESVLMNETALSGFSGTFSEYVLPFNYAGLTETSTLRDVMELFGYKNYSIVLSADETGTMIRVSYHFDTPDGNSVFMRILEIECLYQADADTAVITSISYSAENTPQSEE